MGWSKKRSSAFVGHASNSDSVAVGLRILILNLSRVDSNILLKASLRFRRNRIPSHGSQEYSCFLKACFLCNKNLSPDKDVYMYKGDQGFCSEECRSRQIYVDEMREIEITTKKTLATFRQSHNGGGRCETSVLLEQLRHRLKPLSRRHQVVFS